MKTSKLVVDEVPIEEWHCQSLSGMLGGYTGVYHFTSQNKPLFHKFNSSIATRLLTVDLTHAMAKRIPWIYIYICCFIAIVILWYLKQIHRSRTIIPLRLQGPVKTGPGGLFSDPLSIWQAERIDEGHEDQKSDASRVMS